ncbi:hypothetical protein OA490_01620 [Flavobacteriales bacterium]|nr:hypothetical protein [Flavobacteriales bacterium]
MKKLTLLLLLIPILSFAQIVDDKKLGKVDITKISDLYITVDDETNAGNGKINTKPGWILRFSGSKIFISGSKRKKKWNAYDQGQPVSIRSRVDLLNYFAKYGYEFLDTNSNTRVGTNIATGYAVSRTSTTITFKNNN